MYTTEKTSGMIPLSEYIRNYRDAQRFMGYCRACSDYGSNWSCPPFGFDVGERLAGYEYAYILGVRVIIDEPLRHFPTDTDGAASLTYEILHDVRRATDPLLLDMERSHPDSLAFFAGNCHLCPRGECTRTQGQPCIHPDSVRPSLESFGFDIGRTAADILGIELKWNEGPVLPEYFTLVSGLLSASELKDLRWE